MSRNVKQPVGQKRLTNIAVVRLKKAGNRFEVACYKNKVSDWRSGVEKDLDEVLQSQTVYSNVSKGVLAKEKDMAEAFGTTDQKTICLEILAKGELQVSEKERKVEYDNTFKDVATILAEKTVNVETNRPYTVTIIERALKDIHFNVDPKKGAKQQAWEALEQLKTTIPIARARMRLRLAVPTEAKPELEHILGAHQATTETVDDSTSTTSVIVQIDPGAYRELHSFMTESTNGKGRIDVLSFAVLAEGAPAGNLAMHKPVASVSNTEPVAKREDTEVHLGHAQVSSSGASTKASASSTPAAAAAAAAAAGGLAESSSRATASAGTEQGVLYERGCIANIPDELGSRKEMFSELDRLQPGWQVQLRQKGETVEAVFFSPAGDKVGSFANARRAALAAFKQLKI